MSWGDDNSNFTPVSQPPIATGVVPYKKADVILDCNQIIFGDRNTITYGVTAYVSGMVDFIINSDIIASLPVFTTYGNRDNFNLTINGNVKIIGITDDPIDVWVGPCYINGDVITEKQNVITNLSQSNNLFYTNDFIAGFKFFFYL